jgi:altronate dehydratase large subunit
MSDAAPVLSGHRRPDGRVGVRNHVLVLPSVVCSTHVASLVAGDEAVAITHQHGCLHVGDDLAHTEAALAGTATNPNVGAVVVVGLGCETVQGRRLAQSISDRGQRVAFVGIQVAGGTRRATEQGRQDVTAFARELADTRPDPIGTADLVVGIDRPGDPLATPLRDALTARGVRVLMATEGSAAEAHVELAVAGAQIIVSLPAVGQAPSGFAVCPVVAVARDPDLHRALADDFDVEAYDDDAAVEPIVQAVLRACAEPTAAERRGANDFVLHRLSMTM